MKRAVLCVFLSASLVGCASTSYSTAPTMEVDTAKIASIERAAMRNGVQVIWINQPLKKAAVVPVTTGS
jgi:type IV pilus biogenesis protein CpaD/CtpE